MYRIQLFAPRVSSGPVFLPCWRPADLRRTRRTREYEAKPPDEAPPDKSIYDLLHPTPRELMREMSTDRPDQTESPYTVDAGHFQVEIDLVSAVFDRDRSGGGDRRTRGWGTAVNLKAGLWNNVDIQFVFDPFVHAQFDDLVAETKETASGFADFQTRLKVNLWGNDGGNTALAIMPFVKWPLPASDLRNGQTEGGVIRPAGHRVARRLEHHPDDRV